METIIGSAINAFTKSNIFNEMEHLVLSCTALPGLYAMIIVYNQKQRIRQAFLVNINQDNVEFTEFKHGQFV